MTCEYIIYCVHLMIFIQNRTHPTMLMTILSITAVVTGLMVFLLPETENGPLPETIQEIEAWSNRQCKRKCKTSNWTSGLCACTSL